MAQTRNGRSINVIDGSGSRRSANGGDNGNLRLSLRPAEAAEAIGISERKLAQLMAEGRIPVVRLDRTVILPVAALEQWLAEQVALVQADDQEGGAE